MLPRQSREPTSVVRLTGAHQYRPLEEEFFGDRFRGRDGGSRKHTVPLPANRLSLSTDHATHYCFVVRTSGACTHLCICLRLFVANAVCSCRPDHHPRDRPRDNYCYRNCNLGSDAVSRHRHLASSSRRTLRYPSLSIGT